jgi:hypothetical protein
VQTFPIIDTDEAFAAMAGMDALGMVAELPDFTEHHALAADGDGSAIVCAHDTANGTSRVFEIPRSVTAALADDDPEVEVFHERLGQHLNRLGRAVFN